MKESLLARCKANLLTIATFIIFPFLSFMEASSALSYTVTYTVTNTYSSEEISGSLPWAIKYAREAGREGKDVVIKFNIRGKSPYIIKLEDILWINQKTNIDARTQPGYTGEPIIWIDANKNDSAFIFIEGIGSTIAGFRIYNFAKNAIATQPGADHTHIVENQIGFYWDSIKNLWWRNFEADLSSWRSNSRFVRAVGIGLQSSYNIIENNVISGVHNGISVGYDPSGDWGPKCQGNEIRNNLIGTTPDGKGILTNTPGALSYRPDPNSDPFGSPDKWAYFGNNSDGIYLTALAVETIIANNVCSGNFSAGIELMHDTVEKNVIYNNKCGVDITGNVALPNGELGIIISNGAHDNLVGGEKGANIFSGNPYAGVELGGAGSFRRATGNLIKGNIIGCNANKIAVGHQDVGIHVGTVDAYNNHIEDNIIAGNDWGIYLEDTRDNIIINNFVGTDESGNNIGNNNDGIVIDNSTGNVILNNLVMYNGFNTPHTDWGHGIWEVNGSGENIYSGNDILNNRNTTNTVSISLPGCMYIDHYIGFTFPCVKFSETNYRFSLDLVSNFDNLYWKLDQNSLRTASAEECCIVMDNNLGMSIKGVHFDAYTLDFNLLFYGIYFNGIYWQIDFDTLVVQ
ncbi:MAG: hypothetical protein ACK4ND_18945 [Cytophagaceae bacterium]